MQWSPKQDQAISAVQEWLSTKGSARQWFYLAGYAGTGKTTLAKELASSVSGQVFFAAFTGKAAKVLQQKGCPGACTLHSLIYKPKDKSKERLAHLQEDLDIIVKEIIFEHGGDSASLECQSAIAASQLAQKAREAIEAEQQGLKRPAFELNLDSQLRRAKLLVVDEVSMVGVEMAEDLLSFDVPVLVLGDPAQLPPIYGAGYFTKEEPDILLTEIHRQARDNPIIDLATRVREGRGIELGEYGDSRVIDISDGKPEMYLSHDQILCGRENPAKNGCDNVYRANINRRVHSLLGHEGPYPVPGDKLVCLRNNRELGLLNGGMWRVLESQLVGDEVAMTLESEEGLVLSLNAHAKIFRGEELQFYEMKNAEHFCLGYALTVHKSQGSQWDSVLLFDQSRIFRQDAAKHLYTGLTRAADRVTVIRA